MTLLRLYIPRVYLRVYFYFTDGIIYEYRLLRKRKILLSDRGGPRSDCLTWVHFVP